MLGGDRLDRRLDRPADRDRQEPHERVQLGGRSALGDTADEPLEHGLLAGPELTGDGLEGLREPLGHISIEQLERLDELSGDLGHTRQYRTAGG